MSLRHRLLRSLLCAVVVTGIAAVAVSPATGSPQAAPSGILASCSVGVQTPHYSSGASGVIAKPYWSCPSTDSEYVSSWLGYLYRCTSKPDATKAESTWQNTNGCRAVRSGSSADSGGGFTVPAGQTVVRYIPPLGQTGATSGAWFIACVRGYYSGNVAFARASAAAYV